MPKSKAVVVVSKAEVVLHTDVMKERAECFGVEWNDLGDGYQWLVAQGMFSWLAYIAIPSTHLLVGKAYEELEDYGPPVNGGLTYARDNVFGWDYGHGMNKGTPTGDVGSAKSWFMARA